MNKLFRLTVGYRTVTGNYNTNALTIAPLLKDPSLLTNPDSKVEICTANSTHHMLSRLCCKFQHQSAYDIHRYQLCVLYPTHTCNYKHMRKNKAYESA